MRVLVVNAGSSSLKLRLLGPTDEVEHTADIEPDIEPGADLESVLREWPEPDAVGHRIVHGGTRFVEPVRIDEEVRKELEDLTALAPLHQPKSLRGVDAVTALLPGVPAVACFDTAFHTTIGDAAATYAVPREWRERYAIRRYGFHGLSHARCSARTAELTGARRIVTAHLGAGASLCAVVDGRSVDTTMGFTPLEGLVMATRSGSVDPGLVLWLEEHEGLSPHEVAETLENRSGLLALAGTADMREVPADSLAMDVYVHRLAGGIAAMAAAAGGMEALAFTGGVGEHSAVVRARAAERLAFLGVAVDPARNDTTDGEITSATARVRTLVVPAREDLAIAAGTRVALA
ncbi:acetate/propionate family kinase [Pseudonocardia sp. WMMC193]|uniref:acetate/propionate family kinase n=1 Tax=Pseudonocardia sp. WMMC193 TaxID=2911965 RepID=UPI001EFFDB9B|nr:acetate/propionate family kinase [Pseudonocardia sp. WMMC193]MCF7548634.1 acetate/propionate family kinase [Pseudonocardia sp. WMMC193]